MKSWGKKRILWFALVICLLALFILSFDFGSHPSWIYGVSFSKFHADELGLHWRQTYLALLNDLGVRRFRFSAHWPLTEPRDGIYNFSELDFQMQQAQAQQATVIMAIGRRLPGWPECHVPEWAMHLSEEQRQEKLLRLLQKIVERYRSYDNLIMWQVSNEPFLTSFSKEACGGEVDKEFLEREIELVRKLDPLRPIMLTDGGEFGKWIGAYRRSDVFGTTMYLYIWSPRFGKIRYPIGPIFFRIKHNIARLLWGDKQGIVIELAAEPWLLQPIIETPIDVQLDRMGIQKFNEVIEFAKGSSFDTFYLWGAEWWYWMKLKGHPEHWNRARELFSQ